MIFSDVEGALLALPLAISDSGRNTALPHLTITQLWKMPFSLKCRRKDTKKANRQHDHEFVAFLGIKIGEQPLFFVQLCMPVSDVKPVQKRKKLLEYQTKTRNC